MLVSTSILSIKNNINENIKKLEKTSTDFIHLDVMDNKFVPNYKSFLEEKEIFLNISKKIDVHLMVENVLEYVEEYKIFNPEYITFHVEVNEDINECISKIKKISKVGISLKPNTNIEDVIPYLKDIDLVLIMSVEPGFGGQKFMDSVIPKINELKKLQDKYDFKIEVDGGITGDNIHLLKNVDIVVSGSYITNSEDYEEKIRSLKK